MIIDCARANHNLTNITIGGSNISDELASEFPEDICVNIFVLLFFEQSADCRLFFCSIISEWCFTVHWFCNADNTEFSWIELEYEGIVSQIWKEERYCH